MPNDFFQFKQFLIKQDKCAMKVCTDACLFGAWIAAHNLQNTSCNVLDIGSGTGLLSLMFAQKNTKANIDAIEIDEGAAKQANENFNNSKWKERLDIYSTSIQQFAGSSILKYNIIICNPPFYENDLKSVNEQRNIALHSNALLLEELIFMVDVLLEESGKFFCLLPYYRTKYFEELLLKNNLYVKEKVLIRQTSAHNYFRTIFWVDRKPATSHQTEIIIMNDENIYGNEFKSLLKDYYLHL